MRLRSLHIRNFRSCRDVQVHLDGYTCLVGANGAGKSTVLAALNVLFRHAAGTPTPVAYLTDEDFTLRDFSRPIEIVATFAELSQVEQHEFKAYFRQDRLIVKAIARWDDETRRAEVKQFGARLVMREFAPWFRSKDDGAKVSDLKAAYAELRKSHENLPAAATKDAMEEALRTFEEANRTTAVYWSNTITKVTDIELISRTRAKKECESQGNHAVMDGIPAPR